MAIYLGALSIPVFFIIKILKTIRYFSNPEEWTILKEIISIALVLLGMGIALYFIGFLMEVPGKRWNLPTLLDSCLHAFLVGIIPFVFFTVINYRHLFVTDIVRDFNPGADSSSQELSEKLIWSVPSLRKKSWAYTPASLFMPSRMVIMLFFTCMRMIRSKKKSSAIPSAI